MGWFDETGQYHPPSQGMTEPIEKPQPKSDDSQKSPDDVYDQPGYDR
jgi:hypothetical protein